MLRILRARDRENAGGDREEHHGTADTGGHPKHQTLLGGQGELDDEREKYDKGEHDYEPAIAASRCREHSDQHSAHNRDHPDRDNAYEA